MNNEQINTNPIKYNSVFKRDIYEMYKPRPYKEIRNVIYDMIDEHNSKENTILKLSKKSHSIPFWLYKKVIKFFETY